MEAPVLVGPPSRRPDLLAARVRARPEGVAFIRAGFLLLPNPSAGTLSSFCWSIMARESVAPLNLLGPGTEFRKMDWFGPLERAHLEL